MASSGSKRANMVGDHAGHQRKGSDVSPYGKEESGLPNYSSANSDTSDPLDTLGYVAELPRNRSTLQVTFMSFVLASVPYGLATTLYYPLVGGGPVTIIWGWLAVCCIVFCLVISLGEITSVYPTAGGMYYQTFMLSPPSYRRVLAFVTGWAFVLGNIIITLSVNFGTTLFILGCVNIFHNEDGTGIFAAATYQIYLVFLGITLLCNTISSLANRWLPILDTITIFWTFAGVIAIICCTLAIAAEGRHSARYVFTEFDVQSGWVPGWGFCVGLLHAAYATSASGMVVSMCEEVPRPAQQVPKAMVGALLLNTICGLVFLIPLVFVLPDITAFLNDTSAQPLPVILRASVGSEGGAFALTIPIIVLGILCGTSCTTAASRTTWAFSRDGGIPGSTLWKRINPKLNVPLNAMLLSMAIQLLLGLIYFGSAAAFNAFNGAGVIFLTCSYVIPIAVSFFNGRTHLKGARYDLGRFGWCCNIVSILWCLLAIPLFSMPSGLPVALSTMNYASAVFVGGIAVAGGWYLAWGSKNYTGPPVASEEVSRRRSSVGHDV